MSSLPHRLLQQIKSEGPITFYQWMKAALYDPHEGYYCRSDRPRWGREGDYRTSPERSELFAATFARYFAKLYEGLGSPSSWTIVEVGAGAGHFAASVLETLQKRFTKVFSATHFIVDDVSAESRARAERPLARFGAQVQFKRLEELDSLDSAVIFSNELLDAFPVHRVIMRAGELHEFYVDIDDRGKFAWTIGKPSTERLREHFPRIGIRLGEGQIADVNLEVEDWLGLASEKIRTGYLITVDYGGEAALYDSSARREGTLRAFHRHQFVPVLERPGEHDITSSVDWTLVKVLGSSHGFEVVVFERQDRFLLAGGLLEEIELRVRESGQESERLSLRTSAREMILPGGMAESFQVLVQRKERLIEYNAQVLRSS